MRHFRAILLLVCIAVVGCGSDDSPAPSANTVQNDGPPQQTDSSPDGTQGSTAVSPVDEASSRDQTITDPVPMDLPPVNNALREILVQFARLKREDRAVKSELDQLEEYTMDQVLRCLADTSVDVRRGATYFLMGNDLSNPEVASAFSATLNDEDAEIRHIGLQAVGNLPDDALALVAPQLVKLVGREDEPPGNRVRAARLIGRLGPAGRTGFPAMKETALASTDKQVRKACLASISKIARPADAVVLYRQLLTGDAPPDVRRVAAFWLGQLGSPASVAVDDLVAALEDPNADFRKGARDALAKIGAPAVLALAGKLTSQNTVARLNAVFALGKIGGPAKSALPELRKRLQDDNQEIRELAALVIRKIELSP